MNYVMLLVSFIAATTAFSQSFPNSRDKFAKEFQRQIGEYGSGDYSNFAKKEFQLMLLESSEFPDDYFAKMVETCNAMEAKRLKAYPDIYNYVFSVAAFVKTKQPKASYQAWHATVDKMLSNRNPKKVEDFVDFSAGFFSEGRISTSSNHSWYYFGGSYDFVADDKDVSINFKDGSLVCRAIASSGSNRGEAVDSLRINTTAGTYDPVLKKWLGRGGKVTWEKVGMDAAKTFAMLKGYDLSLKTSNLSVDTVELTTTYFKTPILGSLSDRAFKINREEDKVYPQFLSFERKLVIANIIPDVDYIGGFAFQGTRFIGAGTNENPARVTLKRGAVPFMKASAEQIMISSDKVFIERANFAMFLKSGDSITHPGIRFDFDLTKKNVQLSRSISGIGQAPFQDSYHKLDIYAPKIIWEQGADRIAFTYEFGTSQEQRVATFESQGYFNERVYDQLLGLESQHPLVAISQYCYKYDEYVINEGKAATALGKTVEQAKPTLLKLSSMGFISYDSESKMVAVKPKLENFVKAKAGKKDFDNIVFTSDMRPKRLEGYSPEEIQKDPFLTTLDSTYKSLSNKRMLMKEFGYMDLVSMELELEAVDQVLISESKNAVVFPNAGKVKVKENRNFQFSGWAKAGKFEVETELASFEYDAFKIKLQKTNEGLFRIRPLDKTHGTKAIPMTSSLRGISGEILIDSPENRSGKNLAYGAFPKLKSVNASKIFYNSKDIYRGVYDSTRFYYTVDAFEMDSLNSFDEQSFRLQGELVSAGIFPKIKEPLKIMQDYSFGFSTQAPKGGHPFYGTSAKYEDKIVLSNNGLQGAGKINFVNASAESKALSFLPDSTVGYATFVNKPAETGVQFPDVSTEVAYITYVPQKDLLKAASTPQNDLVFFNKEAKLRGTVLVTPKGMTGNGLMSFNNANLISDKFEYKRFDVKADTSSFRLQNQSGDVEEDALAFKTDNVKSEVSFKTRLGTFNSNEGESKVEFPVNQYMAKMDQFKWFMDELSIEMSKAKDKDIAIESGVDLAGANFFSTHPKQDSLSFRAPKAKFDLKQKTIFCDDVEYIDIADARIYPDSMKLNIRKKAKMDKLMNATIVANYVTKYHKFEKAEVEILAKRDYNAIGEYPFYDRDSNVTYISMKDIGLDSSYQTRATGKVSIDQNFKLSEQFDYYGDVAVRASKLAIDFKGATRINHGCTKFDRNWMAFSSEIDPKNIQIPVLSSMKDLEGNTISAGIVWRDATNTDSLALYPTFLSALVDPNDPIVMTSSGYLQYDDGTKEFQIASKEKLINRGEKGNYIALHTESCSMNGDGVINLGMDYGDVKVDAVGVVNYNQTTGETSMNITARFDMEMDKGIMQGVAGRIAEVEGLKDMDFNSTTLEQAVVEWDNLKAADKFKEEFVQEGKVKKLPEGLEKTMTITGLRLSSYDSDRLQDRGLITNVESAVLVSMYGKPVMKYVPMKAFFQKTYSGAKNDKFMVYINIPGGRDYLFNYEMVKKDGTMNIYSGDTELSAAVNEMKEDKRKKRNFLYQMTTNSAFLAKFMRLYE